MKNYIICREGWLYLIILLIITVIVYFISPLLAIFPGIIFLFVLFFFRNPERSIPADESVIVSPADGVVMSIGKVFENNFIKNEVICIKIFLNIFNVHVNRSPIKGKVVYKAYQPGKMLPAFKSHASEINEKNYIGIENDKLKVLVTQVTGFIARRIVCWVNEGDLLLKGQRFGLIKFGSCTEIFLPSDTEIYVKNGQKVRGGETIIGRVKL